MRNLIELRRKKGELVHQMRSLVERAGVDMSAEDETQFNRINDEIEKIDKAMAREERMASFSDPEDESLEAPESRELRPEPSGDTSDAGNIRDRAFRSYLLRGMSRISPEELRALERRDLQADSDPIGGYVTVPQQFSMQLLKTLDDTVAMRRLGTTMELTSAASLGVPTLDTDVSDADWTAEVAESVVDTAMKFGKRELAPHPLSKEAKISNKLIRLSPLGVESLVRSRLAYKFGITEEKAFMVGDGNQKPLGVFTASTDGISTARDVVTGSQTDFTADGLIDCLYTLKEGYIKRATWLLHRDAVRKIRKLKNAVSGEYIWQPGLSSGNPDTILTRPYVMSEYVPNTFTTGKYVGMVADFSNYWIVTALDMSVQRLNELYARTNQVGFIGRMEVDGMPVLEEAFVRIKTS